MRKIDVFINQKIVYSIELEDNLIKDLSEEEIQELCKNILWEDYIHKFLGKTEIWYNPWKRKK
jgi:hypothetical protein